jgi:hypothetical protein
MFDVVNLKIDAPKEKEGEREGEKKRVKWKAHL